MSKLTIIIIIFVLIQNLYALDNPETEPNHKVKSADLFLDNSGSMGSYIFSAHKIFSTSLQDRLKEIQTNVHFIGSTSYSKLFSREVEPEKIINEWNANGGGTYLWEYIYEVLAKSNPEEQKEVIIITDGQDNQSNGDFYGSSGYNHMMELLLGKGIKPFFNVLCIGYEDCTKNNHYRDMAMASGGSFYAVNDVMEQKEFVEQAQQLSMQMQNNRQSFPQRVMMQAQYLDNLYQGNTESDERMKWMQDLQ